MVENCYYRSTITAIMEQTRNKEPQEFQIHDDVRVSSVLPNAAPQGELQLVSYELTCSPCRKYIIILIYFTDSDTTYQKCFKNIIMLPHFVTHSDLCAVHIQFGHNYFCSLFKVSKCHSLVDGTWVHGFHDPLTPVTEALPSLLLPVVLGYLAV